jgi:DNA modification methylase
MEKARQFRTHIRATNAKNPTNVSDSARHIEMLPIGKLRPSRRNVHQHSKKQVRQIADSIQRFGFINPIVVDERNNIVAGHGRCEAAKLIGSQRIPIIRISHLSETELRAYMLADNKLTENAGWDRELLATELKELQISLPEVGLDLNITGFESREIDSLMMDFGMETPNPADDCPPLDRKSIVAQSGDLFVLDRHRLMVGDARDEQAYSRLMGAHLAEMGFTDPPFNVPFAGHIGGRGRVKHREFVCARGEMTSDEYTAFLEQTLALCACYSTDGAIHYVCMDWRHSPELFAAGKVVYDELKNVCVWVKSNAGQGSFYRNQHELIFVFKRGHAPHLNTFGLGQYGRMRSNVWHYAGVNSFRAGRMDDLRMHPTVKPIALVVDALRDCSRRGSIVLDAFAGSGTTIMAAEQIGRRAFCLELDPAYVDLAIRRWQRFTRRDAILEKTGQSFDELSMGGGRKQPGAKGGAQFGGVSRKVGY